MRKNTPSYVIVHHSNGTARDACASTLHHTVFDIDNWHKTRWRGFKSEEFFRPDTGEGWHVGYHLVTDLSTGKTVQTRGFREEGAHCIGKNTDSIGWLFIGNYTSCSPDEFNKTLGRQQFLHWAPQIMKEFNIPIENIVPHRKFASYKDCYGDKLPDDFFQRFLLQEQQTGNKEVKELRAKVVELEGIVQALQRLVVLLVNQITAKNLSLRESNNYKPAS